MSPEEFGFTDEQWYRMVDAHMGLAQPITSYPLMKSFVYYRKYGLFHVAPGYHSNAMALLYAFENGYRCGVDCAMKEDLTFSSGVAERFLKLPGVAFKSSVSNVVECWDRDSLTQSEKRIFGNVRYIGDEHGISL